MTESRSREYVSQFFTRCDAGDELSGITMSGLEYLETYSPRLFHVLHNICYKNSNEDEDARKVRKFLKKTIGSDIDVHHRKMLPLLVTHLDRVVMDAAEFLYDMKFLEMRSIGDKDVLLTVFKTWCLQILDIMERYKISVERPLHIYDSTCENEALIVNTRSARVFVNYVRTLPDFKKYMDDDRYPKGVSKRCTAEFFTDTENDKQVSLRRVKDENSEEFLYERDRSARTETFVWVTDRVVPEFFGAPQNNAELWNLAYSLTRNLEEEINTNSLLVCYVDHLIDMFNPKKQMELASRAGDKNSTYDPNDATVVKVEPLVVAAAPLDLGMFYTRHLVSECIDSRSRSQLHQLKHLKGKDYAWMQKLVSVLSSFFLNEKFKHPEGIAVFAGEFFVSETPRSFHSQIQLIVANARTLVEKDKAAWAAKFDSLRRRRLHNLLRLISLILARHLQGEDHVLEQQNRSDYSPLWCAFENVANSMLCFKERLVFPENRSDGVFANAIVDAQDEEHCPVMLFATSFVPRALVAYSEFATTKLPLFVDARQYILNFNRLKLTAGDCLTTSDSDSESDSDSDSQSKKRDKICVYKNTLQYAMRPIAGRDLFGQLLLPQRSSKRAKEVKKLVGDGNDLLDAKHSFMVALCDTYDDTVMLSKALVQIKRHGAKTLSLFACLRLCAVERSVFSHYNEAIALFTQRGSWSKGNELSDHINNTMQMLSLFEWYKKGQRWTTGVELLYGILLLEHVTHVYLDEVGSA